MSAPSFSSNGTTTTEIYTLSLHDALPISRRGGAEAVRPAQGQVPVGVRSTSGLQQDRKSTRLNSSHTVISYAVFCLKKKNSVDCVSRAQDARARGSHAIEATDHHRGVG